MEYYSIYNSPIGELLLVSDGATLTGLFFDGKKRVEEEKKSEKKISVLENTRKWLDIYFQGEEPNFLPDMSFYGTSFQQEVWKLLKEIPYGQVVSYGELAKKLAAQRGMKRMSAQAIGGAVGKNPISIIIPCHRVIGSDGSLTGYGGGLDKKEFLLKLEGINTQKMI